MPQTAISTMYKYNYILGHDECRLIDSPCISKRRGKLYATSSFQTSAGSQQSSGFYSLKQISSVMHSIKKIFKQARCFLSYYQGKQVDSKHKHLCTQNYDLQYAVTLQEINAECTVKIVSITVSYETKCSKKNVMLHEVIMWTQCTDLIELWFAQFMFDKKKNRQ